MVSIDTYNACVDFPIFDAKSRSLKKAMLSTAGGAIGKNDHNTVVVEALRDINLHLREGDRVGLVGHNGAGKSTLLRLLSGIYEPTRGSAVVKGRVVPVFDLDNEMHHEEWYAGLNELDRRLAEALADTSPLTIEQRSSRNGIRGRQVTLR